MFLSSVSPSTNQEMTHETLATKSDILPALKNENIRTMTPPGSLALACAAINVGYCQREAHLSMSVRVLWVPFYTN